jgi:hypothetical protein
MKENLLDGWIRNFQNGVKENLLEIADQLARREGSSYCSAIDWQEGHGAQLLLEN